MIGVNMAKGAFISPEEKRKTLEIYARDPSMRAKEVLAQLAAELSDGQRVPSLRTVQRILGNDRKSSDPLGDQEWVLHLMPTLSLLSFGLPILTRLSLLRVLAKKERGTGSPKSPRFLSSFIKSS